MSIHYRAPGKLNTKIPHISKARHYNNRFQGYKNKRLISLLIVAERVYCIVEPLSLMNAEPASVIVLDSDGYLVDFNHVVDNGIRCFRLRAV